MEIIKLSNNLWLQSEADNKKLRLVLTDGFTELACRKDTPGKLRRYLTNGESALFKGRLQLHKSNGNIAVVLKNTIVGLVPVATFEKLLNI
jgi:hypothetical protein